VLQKYFGLLKALGCHFIRGHMYARQHRQNVHTIMIQTAQLRAVNLDMQQAQALIFTKSNIIMKLKHCQSEHQLYLYNCRTDNIRIKLEVQ